MPRRDDSAENVIRSDDAGMSHSVNMALERLIATGLPVSISVMFPTPWYQETVEILKRQMLAQEKAAFGDQPRSAIRQVRVHKHFQLEAGDVGELGVDPDVHD